jgi:LysM repeat protein
LAFGFWSLRFGIGDFLPRFLLEPGRRASYFRYMKRIFLLVITVSLCASPSARSQDAATEERLNKLSGQIEDLIAGQKEQRERLTALVRELETVREQASKPSANYATHEDLKRLAETVKEVDRKRLEDYDKIRAELLKLGKTLSAPGPTSKKSPPIAPADAPILEKPSSPEKGYKYTIQKNDTLSIIVQAYREKNIKITTDQILKANPGLNPNRLRVGQEIFIPAPTSGKSEG